MKIKHNIIFLLFFSTFGLCAEESKAPLNHQSGYTERFINMGAVRLQTGSYGWTPLMQAAMSGNISEAQNFLDRGFDVNTVSDTGDTALLVAIYYKHFDISKLLLNNKADPNLAGSNNQMPLILAVKKGNIELVKLLLDKGADARYIPNTSARNTALDMAAMYGRYGIVKLLAPYLNVDTDMSSALSKAIWKGNNSIAKFLLELGVDPNKDFPLFTAVEQDNYEMVNLLIEYGAKTNKTSGIRKRSPIFVAVSRGNISIAEMLLKAKTNISIMNYHDLTLMDVARSKNDESMIALLKKFNAPDFTPELEQFLNVRFMKLKKIKLYKNKENYILEKIGKPAKIIMLEDEVDYRDPTIIFKRKKWIYDGLEFIIKTFADIIWITDITLNNSKYELINGLHVGEHKQRFIDKLGTPNKLTKYTMMYRIRTETSHDIFEDVVEFHINEKGNVDTIVWQ